LGWSFRKLEKGSSLKTHVGKEGTKGWGRGFITSSTTDMNREFKRRTTRKKKEVAKK